MFGLSLLIIAASAVLATGMAAMGLRIFFRLVEPQMPSRSHPSLLGETSLSE